MIQRRFRELVRKYTQEQSAGAALPKEKDVSRWEYNLEYRARQPEVVEDKDAARAEIERLTQEFLARGGEIQEITTGLGVDKGETAAERFQQARLRKAQRQSAAEREAAARKLKFKREAKAAKEAAQRDRAAAIVAEPTLGVKSEAEATARLLAAAEELKALLRKK